jgi:hypothetical protein
VRPLLSAPAQHAPPPPHGRAAILLMAMCAELIRLFHTNPCPNYFQVICSHTTCVATDFTIQRGRSSAQAGPQHRHEQRGSWRFTSKHTQDHEGKKNGRVGVLVDTGEWYVDVLTNDQGGGMGWGMHTGAWRKAGVSPLGWVTRDIGEWVTGGIVVLLPSVDARIWHAAGGQNMGVRKASGSPFTCRHRQWGQGWVRGRGRGWGLR